MPGLKQLFFRVFLFFSHLFSRVSDEICQFWSGACEKNVTFIVDFARSKHDFGTGLSEGSTLNYVRLAEIERRNVCL